MTQAISSSAPAATLAATSLDAEPGSATNAFDGHESGFGAACAAATAQSNQSAHAAARGAKTKLADAKAGDSGTARQTTLAEEGAAGSRSSSSVDRILQRTASGDGSAFPPRTAKTAEAPTTPAHTPFTDPVAADVTTRQRDSAEAIDRAGKPAGKTNAQGNAKICLSVAGKVAVASAHKATVPEVGAAIPLLKPGSRKDAAKTRTTPQPLAAVPPPPHHDLTYPHRKGDDTGGNASVSLAAATGHGARLPLSAADLGAAAPHAAPDAQPQLLRSTADLASAGGGSARITLHPESLGTVVVKVIVNAQGVTSVHMTASTNGGLQALAAGAGQLAQHLAQSGLTVGAVQTTLTNAAAPPQPATAAQSQGGHLGSGGFAGTSQHPGSGQKQPRSQPQPQDTGQTPAVRPRRGGPDSTVKAYA